MYIYMAFIDNLKEKMYQRQVKRLAGSKKHTSCNFRDAKSIGIIFNAGNEKERDIVLEYKKRLERDHRKKVRLLGFKDVKELTAQEIYPCFCNKDIGWNQAPKREDILDFIEEPFDLLLALHMEDCPPLEFIAATSAAKFRIGHYREEKADYYDLLLYGKGKTLRAFISQTESYLEKIQ
jgi:hypothetical protein